MKYSEIHILVVEDDQTIGKALFEALKRRGYECKLVRTPDDAIQAIRMQEFNAVVVDCMLPKMNGIELTLKLKEICPSELVTILISGIFKDRTFSKDAIFKTNASGFLIKPFAIDSLFTILDDAFSEKHNGGKEGWLALFSRKDIDLNTVQIAIDRFPNVHGFHLPWIYSLLIQTKYSGHLNIIGASGDVSSVTFNNGQITQTQLHDKSSYFGVLLVEKGYAAPEDVDLILSEKSHLRIGERLVGANAISPHAVQVILQEQMKIRLSKTIRDENMEIHLVPDDKPTSDEYPLGWKEFLNIAEDWMTSKFTPQWLQIFYSEWMNFGIQNIAHPMVGTPISASSISEHLATEKNHHKFYKDLHFQLLQRASILAFSNESQKMSFDFQLQRLRYIAADIKNKNSFEVLGLTTKALSREISRAYMDLAKIFHPDKIDPNAPQEIKVLSHEIFSSITTAHDTLKNPEAREKYLKKLEFGRTEEVFLADTLLEQGRNLIRQARFQEAAIVLNDVISMKNPAAEGQLLWLWATMKVGTNDIELLHSKILAIPPEGRHTSLYFMVKGLFYRIIENREKAEKNFKNAIALEPGLLEAKRELQNLKNMPAQAKSAIGEISQIVDTFFGRKKR